jgi:hypothetical protein
MGGISGNAASAVANQHGRRRRRTHHVLHNRSRATVGRPTGHDIATTPSHCRSITDTGLSGFTQLGTAPQHHARGHGRQLVRWFRLRMAFPLRRRLSIRPLSLVWQLPLQRCLWGSAMTTTCVLQPWPTPLAEGLACPVCERPGVVRPIPLSDIWSDPPLLLQCEACGHVWMESQQRLAGEMRPARSIAGPSSNSRGGGS